jgi:hypothetical protein
VTHLVTRKRLYLGLLGVTLVLSAGVLSYVWLTFIVGDTGILRLLTGVFVIAVLLILLVITLGFFGIVLSLLFSRTFRMLDRPMNFTVSILYPIVLKLGKLFKIAQDRIQCSFVEVNNQLVKARVKQVVPERLLILLPHCLQNRDCVNRISHNPDNCRRCGRCSIGELLNLCDRYQVHVRIATGGTLAREAVKELRPNAIVAVACERDLTSGILDCIPLPVLGVTNQRPMGPCINTTVSLSDVEKAILFFIEGGENYVTVGVST